MPIVQPPWAEELTRRAIMVGRAPAQNGRVAAQVPYRRASPQRNPGGVDGTEYLGLVASPPWW